MERVLKIDVLVLNAHPDDSEMAMGGTLIKLAASGLKILNLCLTQGQTGTHGTPEERLKKFQAAQAFISSEGEMWNYADSRLEKTPELVDKVSQLIRTRRPHLVFAPYLRNDRASFQGMANKAHSVVGHIASEAIKLARLKNAFKDSNPHVVSKLFFYMIPNGVHPQVLFDVSDVIEDFKTLVTHYSTQLNIFSMEERLLAMRTIQGSEAGLKFAEAFVTEMPIILNAQSIISV